MDAIYLVFGHPEMPDEVIEEIAGEIKEAALALAPDAETEFAIF